LIFATELEALLHVPVKDPLRTLVERGRLSRHALDERWLYCAADRTRQREQRLARSAQIETFPLVLTVTQTEELKAAVVLFYSLLDEQQRRLFAGLESFNAVMAGIRCWQGCWASTRILSQAAGANCSRARCNTNTFVGPAADGRGPKKKPGPPEATAGLAGRFARGRSNGTAPPAHASAPASDRSRAGGRRAHRQCQHRASFARPIGYCSARQPQRSLQRQRPATGSAVSLHRSATPTLCSQGPADHQRRFQEKELVGCFKNPGRSCSAQPVRVKDHDFRSEALGMAIPYGIYDPQANRGSVYVGTTHDTPQFAVESIGREPYNG
jgi:hypothetical protein